MQGEILEKLNNIERLLLEQSEQVLSFKQACEYLDLSHSALYKLTSKAEIPHSKPNGKRIYFSKRDLVAWLLRNRVQSNSEIEQKAIEHVSQKARGHMQGEEHR